MAITAADIRNQTFQRALGRLCKMHPGNPTKLEKSAKSLWRAAGAQSIVPADLAMDADLITLGLAKNDGGIVYLKFDLSGWDE